MALFRRRTPCVEAEQARRNTVIHSLGGLADVKAGEWIVAIGPDLYVSYEEEAFHQKYEPVLPSGIEREYVSVGQAWHGFAWFMFFAIGWLVAWTLGEVFGLANVVMRWLGVL